MYIWMAIGAIAVGFLAKTYFDVYCAWRAWTNSAPRSEGLVAAPKASIARRALDAADRGLHAFLMSPTAR
jgi:hypothetical protein